MVMNHKSLFLMVMNSQGGIVVALDQRGVLAVMNACSCSRGACGVHRAGQGQVCEPAPLDDEQR